MLLLCANWANTLSDYLVSVQFPFSLGFSIPSFKSLIIVGAVFAVLDFQIRFQWLLYISCLSVVLQWGQRFFSLLWTWPATQICICWLNGRNTCFFSPAFYPRCSTAPKHEGIRLASFLSSLLEHQLLHDTIFSKPLSHCYTFLDTWQVLKSPTCRPHPDPWNVGLSVIGYPARTSQILQCTNKIWSHWRLPAMTLVVLCLLSETTPEKNKYDNVLWILFNACIMSSQIAWESCL